MADPDSKVANNKIARDRSVSAKSASASSVSAKRAVAASKADDNSGSIRLGAAGGDSRRFAFQ